MRELVVPPQTAHIVLLPVGRQVGNVHPSAGYTWRYDMGGPQPVLDVALQEGCSLWLHAKLIWATARKDATPIPSSLNDIANKFLDKFLK